MNKTTYGFLEKKPIPQYLEKSGAVFRVKKQILYSQNDEISFWLQKMTKFAANKLQISYNKYKLCQQK